MGKKSLLTIVTPTYNRAFILNKCYDSLKGQTNKSFIWMIVDDGSTDNTCDIVQDWIEEGIIDIQYYKKENGGKASAINLALDRVNTKYFVCLDSDDTFTYNSVELAIERLLKIENNNKYCGILALRTSFDEKPLGGKELPKELIEATVNEIVGKLKIRSEFICFYKTNIITEYRFPEIVGEKFISPAYIEQEIGRKYKFLVSRKKYCYCEYLADGLTKNKINIIKNNPKGYTLVKRQSFELTDGFFIKSKNAIMYIAGSILSNDKKFIKNSPNILITILLCPLGWLMYRIRFK